MNTTLPTTYIANAKNYGGTKETTDTYLVINDKLEEVATLRIYAGRRSYGAGPVYASIWVHGVCSGTGSASGYGYHKASAAADAAIRSAGIDLGWDISGAGEGAIRGALEDIARAAGHETVRVFTA